MTPQETLKELKKTPELRNLLKHRILQDNVLVLPVDFDEDSSVYTPGQYEDKPEWGMVVAVGEGRLLDSGERVRSSIEEGDFILFGKYSATNVTTAGQDYLFIREEDIMSRYVPD